MYFIFVVLIAFTCPLHGFPSKHENSEMVYSSSEGSSCDSDYDPLTSNKEWTEIVKEAIKERDQRNTFVGDEDTPRFTPFAQINYHDEDAIPVKLSLQTTEKEETESRFESIMVDDDGCEVTREPINPQKETLISSIFVCLGIHGLYHAATPNTSTNCYARVFIGAISGTFFAIGAHALLHSTYLRAILNKY